MPGTADGGPKAAPTMGEHNRRILCGLLGRKDADLDSLEEKGVIGYRPVSPRLPPVMSLEVQKRQGRIIDYESDFREQVREHFEGPSN